MSGKPLSSPHFLRKALLAHDRYDRPPGIADVYWDLINECWAVDPDDRPSFADITRRMLDSDAYLFPGTIVDDFNEYRTRILMHPAQLSESHSSEVLSLLRRAGLETESLRGITPFEDLPPEAPADK
jgi:hypothetical protein